MFLMQFSFLFLFGYTDLPNSHETGADEHTISLQIDLKMNFYLLHGFEGWGQLYI